MKAFMFMFMALLFITTLGVTGFYIKRSWNYYWGYESATVETICEMVKPEYLVDRNRCDIHD